jgi:hypothetical protein
VTDYPLLVFVASFLLMCLSARVGAKFLPKDRQFYEEIAGDFSIVLGATLTLLGLIIGFSFSMAVSRYDQRKNLEEEEANAIGTEYVRAQLLPSAEASKVRALLKDYTEQRMLFYTARDEDQLRQIGVRTGQLQTDLWSAVRDAAVTQPNAVLALVVTGMNDVLNSQGYAQAAWWNRIPRAAWALMLAIAVCCNLLMGYGARSVKGERVLLLVVPLVVSISFLLIADIDSPRTGLIRVIPQNLMAFSESLRSQ